MLILRLYTSYSKVSFCFWFGLEMEGKVGDGRWEVEFRDWVERERESER